MMALVSRLRFRTQKSVQLLSHLTHCEQACRYIVTQSHHLSLCTVRCLEEYAGLAFQLAHALAQLPGEFLACTVFSLHHNGFLQTESVCQIGCTINGTETDQRPMHLPLLQRNLHTLLLYHRGVRSKASYLFGNRLRPVMCESYESLRCPFRIQSECRSYSFLSLFLVELGETLGSHLLQIVDRG